MNLEQICKKVIEATSKVGKFIQAEAQNFDLNKIEHKGKSDLVSYVDKTSEKMLIAELENIIPEAGFIAEENTSDKKGEEYNWIIDPLDGTTNFLHGLPCYSISIALIKGNELLVGVVHELNSDECFYAWKDGGAFVNDKKITVSQINALENSLMVTGFPYSDQGKLGKYLDLLQFYIENTHGVRRLGSAAVDLAYVACGRFEAFYEFGLKPWDLAAGALIVKEAGGKVTDFEGEENYIYGQQLLASNGAVHQESLEPIRNIFLK